MHPFFFFLLFFFVFMSFSFLPDFLFALYLLLRFLFLCLLFLLFLFHLVIISPFLLFSSSFFFFLVFFSCVISYILFPIFVFSSVPSPFFLTSIVPAGHQLEGLGGSADQRHWHLPREGVGILGGWGGCHTRRAAATQQRVGTTSCCSSQTSPLTAMPSLTHCNVLPSRPLSLSSPHCNTSPLPTLALSLLVVMIVLLFLCLYHMIFKDRGIQYSPTRIWSPLGCGLSLCLTLPHHPNDVSCLLFEIGR